MRLTFDCQTMTRFSQRPFGKINIPPFPTRFDSCTNVTGGVNVRVGFPHCLSALNYLNQVEKCTHMDRPRTNSCPKVQTEVQQTELRGRDLYISYHTAVQSYKQQLRLRVQTQVTRNANSTLTALPTAHPPGIHTRPTVSPFPSSLRAGRTLAGSSFALSPTRLNVLCTTTISHSVQLSLVQPYIQQKNDSPRHRQSPFLLISSPAISKFSSVKNAPCVMSQCSSVFGLRFSWG